MDKYLHYKATDLAQEPSFIRWVKRPDSTQKEDWSEWLRSHPNMSNVVDEAKRMVQVMVFNQKEIEPGTEDRLWQNIDDQTRGVRKTKGNVIRLLSYGMAAAIALVFFFTIFASPYDTTIKTSFADTKIVTLPDGSSVALNADSKLEYDVNSWKNNRTLTLKGEGFFNVEKGTSFIVKTEEGNVTVLGTSFNVFARNNALFVQCETGKVSVTNDRDETVLTANESIKISKGAHGSKSMISDDGQRSQWQTGLFSFKNEELGVVVGELERQLNIKINMEKDLLSLKYSGSFNTANGKQTLSEVFWPLNLKFTQDGEKVNVTKQ